MGRVLGYWRFIAGNAWRDLRGEIGGARAMIRFAFQATLFAALLWWVPWLGDLATEMRLLAAGALALVFAAAASWLWLVPAAAADNDWRRQEMIVDLTAALISASEENGAVERIIESLRDGERLFSSRSAQWDKYMLEWEAKFDRMMAADFEAGFCHRLSPWRAGDVRDRDYYREKLDLISRRIPEASVYWRGGVNLLPHEYGRLLAWEPELLERARKRVAEGRRR